MPRGPQYDEGLAEHVAGQRDLFDENAPEPPVGPRPRPVRTGSRSLVIYHLTDDEVAVIKSAAAVAGMSLSAYLRHRVTQP